MRGVALGHPENLVHRQSKCFAAWVHARTYFSCSIWRMQGLASLDTIWRTQGLSSLITMKRTQGSFIMSTHTWNEGDATTFNFHTAKVVVVNRTFGK
jgi:hypothetical protein